MERPGRLRFLLLSGLALGAVAVGAVAARSVLLQPLFGEAWAHPLGVLAAVAALGPVVAVLVARLDPPAGPAELWRLGVAWALIVACLVPATVFLAGAGAWWPFVGERPATSVLWLLVPLYVLVGPTLAGARRARDAGLAPIEPRLCFLPEERAADALAWLSGLLADRGVRFAAVGGLAARAWGASRPLVDLDFFVSGEDLDRVEPDISPFVVRPLSTHRDEHRELSCLRLEYGGIPIELAVSEGARYREAATGEWHVAEIAFARCPRRQVLGIPLPVLAREDLLRLKRRLDRAIDRADVAALERSETPGR
jgi:uncharacterized membrane protein YhaH (DUF805 family)